MVRGEEKQFEVTVDRLLEYTRHIKVSLSHFIQKVESRGDMNWPEILDSFTSICGQINTLMRFTRENRSQFIENRVVLPLLLVPDRDEELVKLTEGRVQMVNHEMVPGYLRTKPDPEIEELEKILQSKASNITPDNAVKQINATNKLLDTTINAIKNSSLRADSEMSRQSIRPSYTTSETYELVLAISQGKGLRMNPHRGHVGGPSDPARPTQEQVMQQQMPQKQNIKAPELKTNIKAGP